MNNKENSSQNTLSASTYLRYIQKYRNHKDSKDLSDDLYQNQKINHQSSSTSILTQASNRDNSSNHLDKYKYNASFKNDYTISADYQNKEKTINRSSINHQDNLSSKKSINYEKDEIQELHKRLCNQEEQTRDLMRTVTMLQAFNGNQEDENNNIKTQIKAIESQIQSQGSQTQIEKYIQEIKCEFAFDLKQIGKEMAVDIISLNKKIEKNQNKADQNLEKFNQKIAEIQTKLERVTKIQQHYKRSEKSAIEKVKKVAIKKSQDLMKDYDTLHKRMISVSKEVLKSQSKSKQRNYLHNKQGSYQISNVTTNADNQIQEDRIKLQKHQEIQESALSDKIYNNQQNDLLVRIQQLENHLDSLNQKNTSNAYQTKESKKHHQLSMSMDYQKVQSPNTFSLGNHDNAQDTTNFDIKQQQFRRNASNLLVKSLERRVSEDRISDVRSAFIKKAKKRIYGGVLDISFSSGSTSFYYDTGKSGDYTLVQPSLARSHSKSLMHRRSASKKSIGRKSFDDVLTILNKSVKKSQKSLSQKSKRQKNQNSKTINCYQIIQKPTDQPNNKLMQNYKLKKDEVMKERAQRLIDISNLNISSQIQKQYQKSRQSKISYAKGIYSKRSGRSTTNKKLRNSGKSQKRNQVSNEIRTLENNTMKNTFKSKFNHFQLGRCSELGMNQTTL